MAAVDKTVPRRVCVSPLVLSTVNVAPKLVEQRAAPAAKACKGVALLSLSSKKENAMGSKIPVAATPIDRPRFAFTAAKDVETPPVMHQNFIIRY